MRNAMYLRKSRVDVEAEAHGEGETLKRHRAALTRYAKAHRLPVTKIYEEVVSGDSIAARPQMQQLLADVEAGQFDGVLVMEIERLARGDTIDQGIVAQAFKGSSTKIITPNKTYDPENEMDEEYFEFGLFMSRREYKTINRRLQRGKIASMNEGKWTSWKVPYGYQRKKLEHEKGYILVPDPETAPVVRHIFEWYAHGCPDENGRTVRTGSAKIAGMLNQSGIKSPTGKLWETSLVRSILGNPVYYGMIRWKKRTSRKVVEDGIQKRKFTLDLDAAQLYQGRHEPLIDKETYDLCAKIRKEAPQNKCPRTRELKNPFAGLCYCGHCGHAMLRHAYQDGTVQMICTYPECPTKGSYLDIVEKAVLEAMRDWLDKFELEYQKAPQDSGNADTLRLGIASIDREVAQIDQQVERAFDLVEQGVYTPEIFVQRSAALTARKDALVKKKKDVEAQLEKETSLSRSHDELVPRIQYVLETYPLSTGAKEKNDLLRSVLDRIEYTKTEGGRYCPSNMHVTVFPKLN